jgi:hypothetical protein
MDRYSVLVGNVGFVFTTNNKRQALLTFNIYLDHSKSAYGRCANESVYLLENGDIIKEHKGSNESYYETI